MNNQTLYFMILNKVTGCHAADHRKEKYIHFVNSSLSYYSICITLKALNSDFN